MANKTKSRARNRIVSTTSKELLQLRSDAQRTKAERDGWREIAERLLVDAFGEHASFGDVPPVELVAAGVDGVIANRVARVVFERSAEAMGNAGPYKLSQHGLVIGPWGEYLKDKSDAAIVAALNRAYRTGAQDAYRHRSQNRYSIRDAANTLELAAPRSALLDALARPAFGDGQTWVALHEGAGAVLSGAHLPIGRRQARAEEPASQGRIGLTAEWQAVDQTVRVTHASIWTAEVGGEMLATMPLVAAQTALAGDHLRIQLSVEV